MLADVKACAGIVTPVRSFNCYLVVVLSAVLRFLPTAALFGRCRGPFIYDTRPAFS